MKKIAHFATILGIALTISAPSLSAGAAVDVTPSSLSVCYRQNLDLNQVLSKLKSCFPNLVLPSVPGSGSPDCNLPGDNNSGSNGSETNKPGNGNSGSNGSETNKPGNGNSGGNGSETNKPGDGNSGSNGSETNKPDGSNNSGQQTQEAYIKQVVELVNREREKAGLSTLTIHNGAANAAAVRAKEIVSSFSHTRPDGTSFATALKDQNVSYRYAGENIAWGQKTPEEVVNAWMNSKGHRENILNSRFTSIGVGLYEQNGTYYWCQLFVS